MLASSWFNRLWHASWWKTADVSTFPAIFKAADPDIMIIFKLRMKQTPWNCGRLSSWETTWHTYGFLISLGCPNIPQFTPRQRTPWHEARIDQKKYWGVDPAVVGGWLLPNFCMSFCSCKGVRQSQLEMRRFQEYQQNKTTRKPPHPLISLTSVFSERLQTAGSVPKKNPDISLRPDLGWRCEAVSTRMIHGLQLLAPYYASCCHVGICWPSCQDAGMTSLPSPWAISKVLNTPPNGRLLSSYRLYTWGHPTSRKSHRKTKHMNV